MRTHVPALGTPRHVPIAPLRLLGSPPPPWPPQLEREPRPAVLGPQIPGGPLRIRGEPSIAFVDTISLFSASLAGSGVSISALRRHLSLHPRVFRTNRPQRCLCFCAPTACRCCHRHNATHPGPVYDPWPVMWPSGSEGAFCPARMQALRWPKACDCRQGARQATDVSQLDSTRLPVSGRNASALCVLLSVLMSCPTRHALIGRRASVARPPTASEDAEAPFVLAPAAQA